MVGPKDCAFPHSWPVSGGNAGRTGAVPCEVSFPLSLVWSRPVDGFLSGGIVADSGIAIYADGGPLPPFTIHAVDLKDGTELWHHRAPEVAVGTPAISDGRVFAGNAGAALCLDLRSGERLWYAEPEGSPDIGRGPHGSGNCVLCVGQWVVFCDNALSILDAVTGRVLASKTVPLEPWQHSGPCATKDMLFLPISGREIARANLVTGRYEESIHPEGKVVSGPMIAGDFLVYGTNRATLCAASLHSLQTQWTHAWSVDGWFVESRPAYANGRVFVGGLDGALHCLDAASGQVVWRSPCCTDEIEGAPTVLGSSVLALTPEGLTAHAVDDGRLLWKSESDGHFGGASCAPAAADGLILVGWDNVYAFASG